MEMTKKQPYCVGFIGGRVGLYFNFHYVDIRYQYNDDYYMYVQLLHKCIN